MSRIRPRPPEAPFLGVGVGLRSPHAACVLERARNGALGVDWFEVISENYLIPGGRPLRILEEVREHRPIVAHGVSMNVGSSDAIESAHLDGLADLARRFEPSWISDHLCWTGVDGVQLHDLMPLPFTGEAIRHVAGRVRRIQDRLGRRIALENVSSYFAWADDEMPEWAFLNAVAEEADCGILLDVNNVYVSARNHGFDPRTYLEAVAPERVFQMHLAGHSTSGPMLIDTHDHPVADEVWALYAEAVDRFGPVSTLIEWDDRLPTFDRLEEEAAKARAILGGRRDAADPEYGDEGDDDAAGHRAA